MKKGSLSEFFAFIFITYARWKGTGEPCPNFLWNFSKISPDRFEKFYGFCYPYVAPFHMVYEFWTGTPTFRLWRFWPTVSHFQYYSNFITIFCRSWSTSNCSKWWCHFTWWWWCGMRKELTVKLAMYLPLLMCNLALQISGVYWFFNNDI